MKRTFLTLMLFSALSCATYAQTTKLIPYLAKNGKYGFCDNNLQLKIPAIYDQVELFSEGFARTHLRHQVTFIDTTGKELIPFGTYDIMISEDHTFNEGMAMVFKTDLGFGFIDKTGKEIISCKYTRAKPFSEGLALVSSDNFIGFIDKKGNEIFSLGSVYIDETEFSMSSSFSSGIALIFDNDQFKYIDKTGKQITPSKYNQAFAFKEGLSNVCNFKKQLNGDIDNECGFIDKSGKIIIPITKEYFYLTEFSEGLVAFFSESLLLYGFKDKTGIIKILPVYSQACNFSNGLALVQLNDQYGYIDKTGKMVISLEKYNIKDYGYMSKFSEGLASVVMKDKYGFINKAGEEVIPTLYGKVEDFKNGIAKVALEKPIDDPRIVPTLPQKHFYIDKTGKEFREL